ncbi:ATP-binding protein [Devosia salina]|uniref:ATP-binding protein n=1 Tax=Devosia salina TaxID=2860336 RepID=UPI001F0A1866|nr:ATP-binding protein [Devosia salina]
MSSERTRSAPPRATALVESLRGLGYTAGSALADVIDNSIAAGASTVRVDIEWNDGNGRVTILDDGRGMDDATLESAMRLGDRSPLDDRDPTDLGRFGLGLKTASFSQGRRLTVASKKSGIRSVLRWDLDYLLNSEDGGWHLLEGADPSSEDVLGRLEGFETGTLVIWEVLDRMLPKGGTKQDLLDLSDGIQWHLEMVFHRLLEDGRLQLVLNKRPVKPWDPFLANHTATWSSPETPLQKAGRGARVQAFVLPHKDHLKDKEYKIAGGPDGWNAHQGFFVYRNDRLLLSGGWLGLGKGRGWNREEPYRLARIRLDIPNSADADWKIDIRKSTARPPPSVREELTHIARDARDRARSVFAYRGTPAGHGAREPVSQAWETSKSRSGTRYRISPNHPAVAAVLEAADKAGNGMRADVLAMLRVIEETVPVQRIWLDTAEDKETPRTGFGGEPPKEVMTVARTLFISMVRRKGMAPELARASLLRTEPFDQYPELIAALTEDN